MYGCEIWIIKEAECWRTDAFELWCWRKTLESLLDCKEIQPVHPTGKQSWKVIGRTDAEAEAAILWSPNKNWLIGKDPDDGKYWRWKKKGMPEDEMAGWHHQLVGHEFEQAQGIGDGQGSLGYTVHGVTKSRTWLSDWTDSQDYVEQILQLTLFHRWGNWYRKMLTELPKTTQLVRGRRWLWIWQWVSGIHVLNYFTTLSLANAFMELTL